MDIELNFEKFGKADIPYILRNDKQLYPYRLVRNIFKDKYLIDVMQYAQIYSYPMKKKESKRIDQTENERIDRLIDSEAVWEIFEFISACYRKLTNKSSPYDREIGLLRYNDQTLPYVVRDGFKYVPLIYCTRWDSVEEKINNKSLEVVMFEGWDLSYLKFASVIQNKVSNDSLMDRAWYVVKFDDLQSQLSIEGTFETFWPNDINESFINATLDDNSQCKRDWIMEWQRKKSKIKKKSIGKMKKNKKMKDSS